MKSRTTRRAFLQGSVLGGAGLLVLRDRRIALGYGANDKLNVASVGVAGMGSGNLRNVSGQNIVALCDVHGSRAAKAHQKHPQAKRYKDARRMLLPKKQFEGFTGPDRTLPRAKGHHAEWIEACKGRGRAFSSFQIGGPMTELIQLGNAAVLIGRPFEYDTLSGQVLNLPEANRHLHREYRAGWSL